VVSKVDQLDRDRDLAAARKLADELIEVAPAGTDRGCRGLLQGPPRHPADAA
jgi:hypothetical protein